MLILPELYQSHSNKLELFSNPRLEISPTLASSFTVATRSFTPDGLEDQRPLSQLECTFRTL